MSRVVAVDLLGYGESDEPDSASPTLPVHAELPAELLPLWNLYDVLVVGHDIGGGIAQLLAVQAPECISALLLVDTIAYGSFPEPTIARIAEPEWDRRIQEIDLVAGLERSLMKGLTASEGAATAAIAALYAAPFEGPAAQPVGLSSSPGAMRAGHAAAASAGAERPSRGRHHA